MRQKSLKNNKILRKSFTNIQKIFIIKFNKFFEPQSETTMHDKDFPNLISEQTKQKINQYLSDIKAGDAEKLDMLIEEIGGTMALIARKYLDNPEDDWYVISEVYRRIGRSIKTFNVFRDGYAWLYTIIKNESISLNTREKKYVLCDPSDLERTIQDNFTETSADWIDLTNALDHLDEESRTIITKIYLQDIPQKQVAREMHLSESAISQRVDKILEKLRKILKK